MNKTGYCIHAMVARKILDAMANGDTSVDISVDLNLSCTTFAICNHELILDAHNRLDMEELRKIAKKQNRIYYLEDGAIEVLEVRGEGYYKLVPTEQAPLLEISGVKMHISKGINPFESASRMAAQVVKQGARVLDTCSGLGYAASAALKLGARQVISVEKSATVMELRKKIHGHRGIFGPNIQLIHADIDTYIRELETESFDSVIHDPPRFSLAGELYGEQFYRQIYRVLKRRGSLFHYTGNPQMLKRGSNFMDNAVKRLKASGFSKVIKVTELMGVTAYK